MPEPIFAETTFFLSPTYPKQRAAQLRHVLLAHGATEASGLDDEKLNTVISDSYRFEGWNGERKGVEVVTDKWVERSIILSKPQPHQYYSTHPTKIFSGVIGTSCNLPPADIEILSAGLSALGGQWRPALTREITHLFTLVPVGEKYHTARQISTLKVIVPHWFDDCVRLGVRVPEKAYEWPEPAVLVNLGYSVDLARERDKGKGKEGGGILGTMAKYTPDLYAPSSAIPPPPPEEATVAVWDGRKLLLSYTLELSPSRREAVEAGIKRAGGAIVRIAQEDIMPVNGNLEDRRRKEKSLDKEEAQVIEEKGVDVYVTRWRGGRGYAKAFNMNKTIGTLAWMFLAQASGVLTSPLDQLLHYPVPRREIAGFKAHEITLTNYTGEAREYLKKLITAMGATFTPSMTGKNTVLVAAFRTGTKADKAQQWSIPVVNHTWLEDCFVQWRNLTVALEKYIIFPEGMDFGTLLEHGGRGMEISEDEGQEVFSSDEEEVDVDVDLVDGEKGVEERSEGEVASLVDPSTATPQELKNLQLGPQESLILKNPDVDIPGARIDEVVDASAYLDLDVVLDAEGRVDLSQLGSQQLRNKGDEEESLREPSLEPVPMLDDFSSSHPKPPKDSSLTSVPSPSPALPTSSVVQTPKRGRGRPRKSAPGSGSGAESVSQTPRRSSRRRNSVSAVVSAVSVVEKEKGKKKLVVEVTPRKRGRRGSSVGSVRSAALSEGGSDESPRRKGRKKKDLPSQESDEEEREEGEGERRRSRRLSLSKAVDVDRSSPVKERLEALSRAKVRSRDRRTEESEEEDKEEEEEEPERGRGRGRKRESTGKKGKSRSRGRKSKKDDFIIDDDEDDEPKKRGKEREKETDKETPMKLGSTRKKYSAFAARRARLSRSRQRESGSDSEEGKKGRRGSEPDSDTESEEEGRSRRKARAPKDDSEDDRRKSAKSKGKSRRDSDVEMKKASAKRKRADEDDDSAYSSPLSSGEDLPPRTSPRKKQTPGKAGIAKDTPGKESSKPTAYKTAKSTLHEERSKPTPRRESTKTTIVDTERDSDAMSVDEPPPRKRNKNLVRRVTMESVMIDSNSQTVFAPVSPVKPATPPAEQSEPEAEKEKEKKSLLDQKLKKGDARTRVRRSLGNSEKEKEKEKKVVVLQSSDVSEVEEVEAALKGKMKGKTNAKGKGKKAQETESESEEDEVPKKKGKEAGSSKKAPKAQEKEAEKVKPKEKRIASMRPLSFSSPAGAKGKGKKVTELTETETEPETEGEEDESPSKRVTRMESIRMAAPERPLSSSSPAKAKSKPQASSSKAQASSSKVRGSSSPPTSSPLSEFSSSLPRRNAAAKATQRLKETVMPDVMNFQTEMRKARKSGQFTPLSEKKEPGGLRKRGSDMVEKDKDEERETKKRKVVPEKEVTSATKTKVALEKSGSAVKGPAKGKGRAPATDASEEVQVPTISAKSNKGKNTSPEKNVPSIILATTQVNLSDEATKALVKLGVKITEKPAECTHLLANQLVRTEKFICAVAMGAHILTEKWALDSIKAKRLFPEDDYILDDKGGEKRFKINLKDVLRRSQARPSRLLEGVVFYITPKTTVSHKLLKNVITSCGGQLSSQTPTVRILSAKDDRYVISCEEDVSIWRPISNQRFPVYLPELVLMGALRQQIEWESDAMKVPGSF